ncbi:hypothetical protein WMY93_018514 [Mugilogobius chulae]|uniref:Phospholipase A2 n=1 Tax=Mugilogobius chulae TaxID=88201 RepID=A0AAW0NJ35_9GOBI
MAFTFLPWSKVPAQPWPFHVEFVSYWTLNVTVLRARTETSRDYLSQSDLYVALTLPTATATTRRTKTINNNNKPEWNEGFSFRVPQQTKNILEIRLFDEDLLSRDDLISTVLFDLETLQLDQKLCRSFSLGPQTKDVLEMEFELKRSGEKTQEYPSNGILMAAPLSVLNVKVQKLQETHYLSCSAKLLLSGAYEGTQPLKDKLHFHMNRELETELGLTEEQVSEEAEVEEKKEVLLSCVPLKPLPPQHSANVSLALEKDTVDLHLELSERSKEELGVRLSLDVPLQEKEFVQKRRKTVARALQTLLHLETPPPETQVPTIAVVASGGGARANTGALSTLCQHEDWSHSLESVIRQNKQQMTKSTLSAFSMEQMKYYYSEMEQKEKQGHLVSYIDMAGLILEHLVFGQKTVSTLSDQQKTVKNAQNPLPIYTAVNIKDALNGNQAEAEWVEFTPFEVEASGDPPALPHGHLEQRFLPEPDVSVAGSDRQRPQWTPEQTEVDNIGQGNEPSTLDTLRLSPESGLGASFSGFFKNRPIINETFNFTRGLSLHQNYCENTNFLAWKDSHPDAFPNQLTPSDPTLHLIDSGHSINIGCPPVLRPERHVDLIIVLSYSWDPDNVFKVLEKTSEFCEEHKVDFPSADYKDLKKQPQREVYVFEDSENPKAPSSCSCPWSTPPTRNTRLQELTLEGLTLEEMTLEEMTLEELTLEELTLEGLTLEGLTLEELCLQNVTRPTLRSLLKCGFSIPGKKELTLEELTLEGLTLEGLTLEGLTLEGLTLKELSLEGLTLEGLALEGLTLEGLTLEELTLEGLTLEGLTLEGLTLKELSLEGLTLEGLALEGLTLEGLTLEELTLEGLTLEGPTLKELSLEGLTLEGLTLKELSLEGLTLEGLALEGLTLEGLTLEELTLEGLTLEGPTLKELSLEGLTSEELTLDELTLETRQGTSSLEN